MVYKHFIDGKSLITQVYHPKKAKYLKLKSHLASYSLEPLDFEDLSLEVTLCFLQFSTCLYVKAFKYMYLLSLNLTCLA